jgi:hypothetical protein
MESGGFRPNVVPPTFESNVGRSSTGQSGLPGVSGQSGRDDGFSNFRHDEFDEDHDEVPEISESNWSVPPISCRDTRSQFENNFMMTGQVQKNKLKFSIRGLCLNYSRFLNEFDLKWYKNEFFSDIPCTLVIHGFSIRRRSFTSRANNVLKS